VDAQLPKKLARWFSARGIALQDHYIQTIDSVVLFLQGRNPAASLSNAFLTFLDFFWMGLWLGVAKVVYVFELCLYEVVVGDYKTK
jgi:hypothetical protein